MWRFILTVCLLSWSCDGTTVTCKDEKDQAVDWYILYKGPRKGTSTVLTGLSYLYIDPEATVKKMNQINNPRGPLANTLKPLFRSIRSMEPSFGFISYNDQPPGANANVNKFGHSKGLLMVNKVDTGVWLLHSTPQFPYRRNQNQFWPPSGGEKGQIFMCVTFNYKDFKTIGTHLQQIRAFPFEHDIPNDFHQELKDAAEWKEITPPTTFPTLTSKGNQAFKVFSKQVSSDLEVGDLYFTIAKELRSDVYVQTWGCQWDESHAEAGQSVLNIDVVKNALGEWKPPADHSKWCVATDQNKHWTCVGDVNRGQSQYLRFGGALCVNNEKIQQKFLTFAKEHDICPPCRKRRYPECDPHAFSRMLLLLPTLRIADFDTDFLNGTDTGVIIDYDTDFLNGTDAVAFTDTDTQQEPSLMG
ncbi:deoxyribonuclease-2-beta-like [Leuresthes tenuis]|uniref:deoxyribonuclease-2-beta-like n=1 Tax=Leuresthes tenuis TaxID=355514 RepID=UPI003B50F9D2